MSSAPPPPPQKKKRKGVVQRLRGAKALVHDLVDATTHLVDEGHESTARAVLRVTDHAPASVADTARIVDDVRRLSTKGVLGTVRIVNRAVEAVTDLGIDAAEQLADARAQEPTSSAPASVALPMRSDVIKSWSWAGDAALALVNAAVGDQLRARDNGLDVGMVFRLGDRYVSSDDAAEELCDAIGGAHTKLAIFVHGLATTEWCWSLEAEAYHGDAGATFGTMLERDLGYQPVFLRYNTGAHISENGRALATRLEALFEAASQPPVEIVLVGHSMGGLVVRSACHYATEAGHAWVSRVKRVFSLGSPHRGAPLEKLGNVITGVLGAIDLPGTLVTARILERRSAGIKDLRHGSLVDEDWAGRDPDALVAAAHAEVPMLPHASYHFIAATITRDPAHPLGQIIGDLLVRPPSGAGPHVRERHFAIETACYGGVMHHQLQCHPDVYEALRRGCAGQDDGPMEDARDVGETDA